jgi:hypothetical protein
LVDILLDKDIEEHTEAVVVDVLDPILVLMDFPLDTLDLVVEDNSQVVDLVEDKKVENSLVVDNTLVADLDNIVVVAAIVVDLDHTWLVVEAIEHLELVVE